jgi:antitoxin ParD1/3/4
MNVSLTPEFESYVEGKLKSGSFSSASEVVRAGLRLLQEHDAEHTARLEALRQDVRLGRAQLSRGEGTPGAEVFKQLRKKNKGRSAK